MSDCPLCASAPAADVRRVFETPRWRVVRVLDAPAFPGFYRLIWTPHVAEFSQLSREARIECMDAVTAIERVLIATLAPTKVNLASLGNVVPHLHWHVIARFEGDTHFPRPIWAEPIAHDARLALPARSTTEFDMTRTDQAMVDELNRLTAGAS